MEGHHLIMKSTAIVTSESEMIALPVAYLLALSLGWGLVGAWSAMALDFSLRGTVNFLRYRSGRWKTIKV